MQDGPWSTSVWRNATKQYVEAIRRIEATQTPLPAASVSPLRVGQCGQAVFHEVQLASRTQNACDFAHSSDRVNDAAQRPDTGPSGGAASEAFRYGRGVEVAEDFICAHGMPKPWATCIDCMELPYDQQPKPPREIKPPPGPRTRAPAKTARKKQGTAAATPGSKRAAEPPPPRARLPRTVTDPLPDLVGDCDLAYEIVSFDLRYHISGPEADWLPVSSLPSDLRAGGYVYLQVDQDLVARAKARHIGFRERRWDHAGPDVASDLGPGATIEVGRWEMVAIELGPDGAVPVPGFRYLTTSADGSVRVVLP